MSSQLVYILSVGTIILVLLVLFIVGFVIMYQKRHSSYLHEKRELENLYEQEKMKAQLEIQEQTFNRIGQEIHDNIGQVLSLVRLQLNSFGDHPLKEKIDETDGLVLQVIKDLRNLSHALNNERFNDIGIIEAIRETLQDIGKTGFITTEFHYSGHHFNISQESSTIVFRIVQEALNNVIKHAQATEVKVWVDDADSGTTIRIQDNGNGFNTEIIQSGNLGIGLKNILSRARLINANIEIQSSPGLGTSIIIKI